MAKRKRLSPAASMELDSRPGSEPENTKAMYPLGVAPKPRAPIAQVAGDAAAQAALEELSKEMEAARREGRLVQSLPLTAIVETHMVRDRMVQDPGEMAALKASLVARGQQTPIEVVDLGGGRFGLISGWRRLNALRALEAETGEARFSSIQALIRPIETVSDSYVAMVEENEIRANLSFYERAHLACAAADLGVYPTPQRAVQVLFANTTPAKRSKINSFVKLHRTLAGALHFPEAIPEKLGLALVAALEAEPARAKRLRETLRRSPPADGAAERATLEALLKPDAPGCGATARTKASEPVPGIRLERSRGRAVLSGPGVTTEFVAALESWLKAR